MGQTKFTSVIAALSLSLAPLPAEAQLTAASLPALVSESEGGAKNMSEALQQASDLLALSDQPLALGQKDQRAQLIVNLLKNKGFGAYISNLEGLSEKAIECLELMGASRKESRNSELGKEALANLIELPSAPDFSLFSLRHIQAEIDQSFRQLPSSFSFKQEKVSRAEAWRAAAPVFDFLHEGSVFSVNEFITRSKSEIKYKHNLAFCDLIAAATANAKDTEFQRLRNALKNKQLLEPDIGFDDRLLAKLELVCPALMQDWQTFSSPVYPPQDRGPSIYCVCLGLTLEARANGAKSSFQGALAFYLDQTGFMTKAPKAPIPTDTSFLADRF